MCVFLLLSISLGVQLRDHITTLCSTFWGTIFQSAYTIFTHQDRERAPVLTHLWYCYFLPPTFLKLPKPKCSRNSLAHWEAQEAPMPSSPSGCLGRSPQGSLPHQSVRNLCPHHPPPRSLFFFLTFLPSSHQCLTYCIWCGPLSTSRARIQALPPTAAWPRGATHVCCTMSLNKFFRPEYWSG